MQSPRKLQQRKRELKTQTAVAMVASRDVAVYIIMAGAAATEYRCSPVLNDTRRTRLSLRSCEHTLASKCGFQNTLLEAPGTCEPMDSDMPPPAMSFFPGAGL